MQQTEQLTIKEDGNKDEAGFEIVNPAETATDDFGRHTAKLAEGLTGENNFQHGSLEEVKISLGLDFSQWEKTAQSMGGDILKKDGKEWLFETEEGEKVSNTEQVKGSSIESSHLQILDGLYNYGYAVSGFISHTPGELSRELHIYFADENGRISYEIYKFQETGRQENISEIPPADEVGAPGLSPADAEPIVISLDEILGPARKYDVGEKNVADAVENLAVPLTTEFRPRQEFNFYSPIIEEISSASKTEQFNFQEFFEREASDAKTGSGQTYEKMTTHNLGPTLGQRAAVEHSAVQQDVAESFGIKLILDEPVNEEIKTSGHILKAPEVRLAMEPAAADVAYAKEPIKEPLYDAHMDTAEPEAIKITVAQESKQLIKELADNTFVREIVFEGELAVKEKAGPITEATEPKNNFENKIKDRSTDLEIQPAQKDQIIRREIPQVQKREISIPALEKTEFPTKIFTPKIETGQEIITKIESEYINNLKSEPEQEHRQDASKQIVRKAALKIAPETESKYKNALPLDKPEITIPVINELETEIPTLKIDIKEQIITKDEPKKAAGIQAERVLKPLPAKNLQEAFYNFLEQGGIAEPAQPAQPIQTKPIVRENKTLTAPRATLEILHRIIPPQREIVPQVNHQVNKQVGPVGGFKSQPTRRATIPTPLEGRPAKAAKPAKPNLLQQIILLSSTHLKTAPQQPAMAKAVPIKQNISTAETQAQIPRPGMNEINTRRAIPIDQIINEQNNRSGGRRQALQITA